MRLPIKAQIITQNAMRMRFIVVTDLLMLTWILKQWSVSNRSLYSAENLATYGNEKAKNVDKRKVRLHNKVR